MGQRLVSTFSLVAIDLENGDLGIAVQSKFLAVGAVVPWARSAVGAVATQAWGNTTYGPDGLRLLEDGESAQETLDRLLEADEGREHRQVGVVDAYGNAATFTGSACYAWAGGRTGHGYAAQGNILVGRATVDALAETFEATRGPLADRLLAALAAGQAAGGDSRGMQSAALLVVRANAGYSGFNDRYIDLRVDDHPSPIEELLRLRELHRLYLERTPEGAALPITPDLLREVQTMLAAAVAHAVQPTGLYDDATRDAMRAYVSRENLEMREVTERSIDPLVLDYMRTRHRAQSR